MAEAPAGQAAHTNGRVVFVSAGGSIDSQRREVVLQCALLAAGSLDLRAIAILRGRPAVARRYLSLEGRRALVELADRLRLAATLIQDERTIDSAEESLEIARSRARVAAPPAWFGVIKPSLIAGTPQIGGGRPTERDLHRAIDEHEAADHGDDEDDGRPAERSKILTLFESPVSPSQALADLFRKMLGSSRARGGDDAGGHLQARAMRKAHAVGITARPSPTRIHFVEDRPGAAVGVNGALHPEWDTYAGRYRPDWCRVIDFPLTTAADLSAAAVVRDDVLRRRLSRVGLGPRRLRGRPDGDELDLEALIAHIVDLRIGYSPGEHVYTERRNLDRNLGVLVLLDASGSVTGTDTEGLSVHDHQRRAAATLAATLEELGDRVAVYAFRSLGRDAVHLLAVKTFTQRFGALSRARLNRLEPSGYTRLGAAVRGASDILKRQAGTPHRLLVVLSDGYPYDSGYEGRYAEADAHRALAELRADGVACLCLSLGATADTEVLARVFGSVGHAAAPALAALSPRMDELFGSALRELAAPNPATR